MAAVWIVAQAFASLPFDHIVFTGSPAVGKEIMRAASANLTPVTLELGGKSPAIVAPQRSVAAAAKSIAHGKAFNAGQACVAPDYALVPRERIDEFVAAAVSAFQQMYPDPVTIRITPRLPRSAMRIACMNCSPMPSPRARR